MHYNKKVTRYHLSSNPVFKNSTIFLYDVEKNNTQLVARLYFEPNNRVTLTPHRFENGVPVVYYHQRDWAMIVDLLRNESPLYFWAYVSNGVTISNAMLNTDSTEPVGEGEIPNPNIV